MVFFAFPDKVVSFSQWRKKFEGNLHKIWDDLPEPRYINTELKMWEEYWLQADGVPPATLADLLPRIDKLAFPNIFTAMQILATLPLATCTCGRSISALRRPKTYLRSTMTQERLTGLALIDVDEVIIHR